VSATAAGGPSTSSGRRPTRAVVDAVGWSSVLLPAIPLAVLLDVLGAGPALLFFVAAAGVVPTAAVIGRATEELADRAGPGIGGLINVTFGNAPEIIISLFALNSGLQEVVKASLIGSILSNVLLVLGSAMLVGGLGRERQRFDRTATSAQSLMLLLAVAALVMPAIFELVRGAHLPGVHAERVHLDASVQHLSVAVALVLMVTYGLGLVFSLKTHRDLFNPPAAGATDDEDDDGSWSVRTAVLVLAGAGLTVAGLSEILVSSISDAAKSIGLSEFFIAMIVVAIVGNAAEHWVAVTVARKGKMDLAVGIAIGSSTQIALFAVPVVVLASFVIGPAPMPFVLNGFELGATAIAVLVAAHVTANGESTWFEGVQLLAVYVVLALTFGFA